MKTLVLTSLLSILCLSLTLAQVGNPFPPLEGETLDGTAVSLPEGSQGKYTLVGMAYSKRAEQDLQTWFLPVYRAFVQDREGAGLFASFSYDINVYFIPMFTGAKRVASAPAFDSAKRNLDDRLHPLVLFYVGGLDEYRKALEFEGKNKPYFFLLDEEGTIVWAGSGKFTEEKLQAIQTFLDDL